MLTSGRFKASPLPLAAPISFIHTPPSWLSVATKTPKNTDEVGRTIPGMSNPSPLRTHAPNPSFTQENAFPSGFIYLKAEAPALTAVRF